MKFASYWQDTAPTFAGGAKGPVSGRADVAIIGGGFTGLSAALHLAREGADIVVLEAGRVLSGASGRTGGHCDNGLVGGDFAAAARRLGLEEARALWRAHDSAVESVERLIREERIDCDFQYNGKIRLASTPAHYERLARGFELLHREADPDTMLLTRAELREEVGSDLFHGGLVQHRSAQMHMGRFGVGLAPAATMNGARIYEDAAVTRLARTRGTAHRVSTARGEIEVAQVLVATGASQRGPFGWFRRRVFPATGLVVATEPLPEARLDAVLPSRRAAATTRAPGGEYFRATPDGRIVFGHTRYALPRTGADAEGGLALLARLRETFPQLGNVRLEHCWGGVVDMTADRLPRAGERKGLYYVMGFSGHGVPMAIHMGACMARVMSGAPAANPLRNLAWPAIPGHFGRPWFLPLLGAWHGAKERFA